MSFPDLPRSLCRLYSTSSDPPSDSLTFPFPDFLILSPTFRDQSRASPTFRNPFLHHVELTGPSSTSFELAILATPPIYVIGQCFHSQSYSCSYRSKRARCWPVRIIIGTYDEKEREKGHI
jgi:hypothetical protein